MLCSLAEELYDVHSFGGSVGWLVINDVYFGGIYLSGFNLEVGSGMEKDLTYWHIRDHYHLAL